MLMELFAFITNTTSHIFIDLLFLRFIFTYKLFLHRSHIGRFAASCTDWLIFPVRFIFPIYRGLDLSCIVIAYCISAVQGFLLSLFLLGMLPPALWNCLFYGLIHLTIVVLNMLSLCVFLQVILSWVNPLSPMMIEVMVITDGFLAPIQKRIPLFSGIDFSAAIFLLSVETLKLILRGLLPFWWY